MPAGYEKKRVGLVEYQRFQEEYFTGCDIRLFFGDKFIDEIYALNVQVQEKLEPIFGYASYTADAFARGARVVSGTFVVNFRDGYYLRNVIDDLGQQAKANLTPWKQNSEPFKLIDWANPLNLDEVLNQSASDPDAFEKIAQQYQARLWGESNAEPWSPLYGGEKIPQGRDTFFVKRGYKELAKDGFNILITYGNVNEKEKNPSTANSIIGVQVNGLAKTIQADDGSPVREVYTFFAKDFDDDITSIQR